MRLWIVDHIMNPALEQKIEQVSEEFSSVPGFAALPILATQFRTLFVLLASVLIQFKFGFYINKLTEPSL